MNDMIGGHLCYSSHKVIGFKISVARRKSTRKISPLDMRRADLRLLREIVSKIPGKILPKVLGSIAVGHILGITS